MSEQIVWIIANKYALSSILSTVSFDLSLSLDSGFMCYLGDVLHVFDLNVLNTAIFGFDCEKIAINFYFHI